MVKWWVSESQGCFSMQDRCSINNPSVINMYVLSSFSLEQGHHELVNPGISIQKWFVIFFFSYIFTPTKYTSPNLHPPLLHHQWPWLWCKPDQKPPLFLSTLSQPGCLSHLTFSFQLQNTTLFSATLVNPYWVCSHSAIPRWLFSRCQQSHPLYPSFFNQAPQKVEPSTITINFSFISSSTLVMPLTLPASSFPHLCSRFHFNFLRLLLPPQTYHRAWLQVLVHPNYKVNPHWEEAFTILHRFFHDLKMLCPFTASCSSGC